MVVHAHVHEFATWFLALWGPCLLLTRPPSFTCHLPPVPRAPCVAVAPPPLASSFPHGLVIQTASTNYASCVHLPSGAGSADGEDVVQWECSNAPNQIWMLLDAGDGWYRVGAHATHVWACRASARMAPIRG